MDKEDDLRKREKQRDLGEPLYAGVIDEDENLID